MVFILQQCLCDSIALCLLSALQNTNPGRFALFGFECVFLPVSFQTGAVSLYFQLCRISQFNSRVQSPWFHELWKQPVCCGVGRLFWDVGNSWSEHHLISSLGPAERRLGSCCQWGLAELPPKSPPVSAEAAGVQFKHQKGSNKPHQLLNRWR